MPTPEEEFDQLIGTAPSDPSDQGVAPESPAIADARQLAAGTPEAEFDKLIGTSPDYAQAQDLAANVPLRGEQTPSHELPWYTNAFNDAPVLPVLAENLASGGLANTSDEIGAAAITPKNDPVDRMKTGISHEGPNTYAAGSQFEGLRQTLEQEKLQRDEAAPGTATVGKLIGGGLQAAALPGAATSTALGGLAAGAGMTAANYLGQGSGGLDERSGQAAQEAADHPVATAAGVLGPAVAGGVAQVAKPAAKYLADRSAMNRVAAFTNPAWRSKYVANSPQGKQGIINLGNDIVERGLHKPSPEGPWFKNLLPASAENMYDNAVQYGKKAGTRLETAEDAIGQVNPEINTGSLVSDLRGGATEVMKRADEEAALAEANFRNKMAAGLEKNQTKIPGKPSGPPPLPPKPSTPEWYESTALGGVEPNAQEMADYEKARELFLNPPEVPSGKSTFKDVVADRRHMDKQTNYLNAGGIENAGMKDMVRRQTTAGLRRQTDQGLKAAELNDPSLATPINNWRTANKDYSVAATMEDPALAEMSKEYGGGLGLKDMATASVAQTLGIPTGTSLALSKGLKGGRGANALAGSQKNMSRTFGAVNKGAESPATLAATQTMLPDPEVQREKNQSLKDQLSEAAAGSWDWFKHLLK